VQREWEPIFSVSKPCANVPVEKTAWCTAWTIWVLVMWWKGLLVLGLSMHRSASTVAWWSSRCQTQSVHTLIGQLGFEGVAWWMRVVWPCLPFFRLSIFSWTMVGQVGPLHASSHVRLLVAEKKAISLSLNCWVRVDHLQLGTVYLPMHKRKKKVIRQSSPVACIFAEPILDAV